MHPRAGVLCTLLIFLMSHSLFGQETASPVAAESERLEMKARLDRLQAQIDALVREAAALRAELDGTPSTADAAPADDLLTVEPVAMAEPATQSAEPELPSEVVANVPAPAGNVFNPDVSAIGQFFGHAGTDNPFEPRDTAALDEVEISLQAFVDPYARGKFFVAITPEGAEIEEGFAEFIALPWDVTAKAGKMKASFGKANTWHSHVRPWIDQPLVLKQFFGDEGLADSGVSVTKILPNHFAYVDATAEVFSGNVEGVFERQQQNDLFYNGHLKLFRDLSENSNLEIGTSYAIGTAESEDEIDAGHSRFAGIDVTYRWKPLRTALRRGVVARMELMQNDRDDQDDDALGLYTSLDYQFARRWVAGVRYDLADRPFDPASTDRALSLGLTFRPSEFSQLRAQFRRSEYEGGLDANEVLLQLQFSIGAHGAHTF
ncbi:MAG: type IV pilus assembly protein FimV [Thermoanaerobaculia bacterium]